MKNEEYLNVNLDNKFDPSQKLISSSLKRQKSLSSDKNSNNSFENNRNSNDFIPTNIHINKRTQISKPMLNLTQQKRL